jgi:hypothetical protein
VSILASIDVRYGDGHGRRKCLQSSRIEASSVIFLAVRWVCYALTADARVRLHYSGGYTNVVSRRLRRGWFVFETASNRINCAVDPSYDRSRSEHERIWVRAPNGARVREGRIPNKVFG